MHVHLYSPQRVINLNGHVIIVIITMIIITLMEVYFDWWGEDELMLMVRDGPLTQPFLDYVNCLPLEIKACCSDSDCTM